MSKIRINKISISNFLVPAEVEVPLNNLGPLLLVQGKNGTGKSTLFSDAIVWGLFGKLPRGNCPAISLGKGAATVSIDLTVGEEDISIRRHQDSKGSTLDLMINEEEIQGRIKTLTEEIKKRLGDPEMFLALSVFDQGFGHRLTALNGTERMNFMELFTDASLYEKAEARAREAVKKIERDMVSLLADKSAVQAQISNETAELGRIDASVEKAKESLAQSEQQRKQDIEQLRAQERRMSTSLTFLKEQIAQLESTHQDNLKYIREFDSRIHKGSAMISAEQARIADLKARQQGLLALTAGSACCPTCQQAIPHETMVRLQEEVSQEIVLSGERLKWYQSILNGYTRKREAGEKLNQDVQAQIITRQTQIHEVKGKLGGITSSIQYREKESIPESSLVESHQKRREDQVAKIKLLEEKAVKLIRGEKVIQDKMSMLEFWQKGFSVKGIRSYLMDGLLEKLNEVLGSLSSTLFEDRLKIRLSPEEELKSGEMRNRLVPRIDADEGALSYRSLSGGQRRCVDIAINLSLRQLAEELGFPYSDILVADEVFGSLDERATKEVLQILTQVPGKVIVISHEESLKEHFSEVLTVSRNNGQVILT